MGNKEDTFWELLEPEYIKGMMFCRKLMGDRDNGDDLYQDALVAAFTGFEGLKNVGAFRSWFYRILINTFKSTVRRPWWKRRVTLTAEMKQSLACDDPTELLTARRWLDRAFQAVSTEQQALVTLHELEGWSINELAELYGKTEGSIKGQLFRARNKMKEVLNRFSQEKDLNDGFNPILQKDL
jgi:RNA polymerase sigma-70 factor (ECF subfamily)